MALRCRWQMQQGHWCAAVDKIEEQRKPEDFIGHRKPESSSTKKPRTPTGFRLSSFLCDVAVNVETDTKTDTASFYPY